MNLLYSQKANRVQAGPRNAINLKYSLMLSSNHVSQKQIHKENSQSSQNSEPVAVLQESAYVPIPTSEEKVRSAKSWKCLRSLKPGVPKWVFNPHPICSREERALQWIRGLMERRGSVGISQQPVLQW